MCDLQLKQQVFEYEMDNQTVEEGNNPVIKGP